MRESTLWHEPNICRVVGSSRPGLRDILSCSRSSTTRRSSVSLMSCWTSVGAARKALHCDERVAMRPNNWEMAMQLATMEIPSVR